MACHFQHQLIHSFSATTTVTVVVEDINDHIPRFQKKFYYVEIQENLPAGSSVLSLSAIDMDIGINARLFYSLQVPEDRHYFTISNIEATNSGVIRIHKVWRIGFLVYITNHYEWITC